MTYDIIETNPQYYTTSGVLYMKKYKSFFLLKKIQNKLKHILC